MATYEDYYTVLTTRSAEETEIANLINKENERFEATKEYIEHRKKIDELIKKENEVFNRRLSQARERRPRRNKIEPAPAGKVEKEPDSEELTAAIEAVNKLSFRDKRRLHAMCFDEEIPVDEEMKVDDKIMDEFHEILVQTAIDFIKEKGLKDVWSVGFYADSLQESAEYGRWCPATDSSLTLEAIRNDKVPYRIEIGHSF